MSTTGRGGFGLLVCAVFWGTLPWVFFLAQKLAARAYRELVCGPSALSALSTRTCVRECVTGPGAHIPGLCEVLLVTAAAAVLHAITQLAPPPPYSLRVPSSFRLTVSRLPPRDKSFLDLAHLGLHAANASVRPITSTCPTPFVIFVAS